MGPQPEAGKCGEEGGAPAGSNENQQTHERGPVCAPDAEQAQTWKEQEQEPVGIPPPS